MSTPQPQTETETQRSGSSRGAHRRNQLVACTIDLLCDTGLAGTSVGEVAALAGVSKGVVSYHFPTKDLLLGEVVTSLYTRAAAQLQAQTSSRGGPVEAIVAYIDTNLAFIEANSRHVRAVMEIVASGTFRAGSVGSDPVLADLVRLIEEGEFDHVHAPSLALIIRSAIDTAAARSATGAFDIPTFADQLCTMVRLSLEQEA